MLAERGRDVRLDEVHLLIPGVEPGPVETEVGPVSPFGQAEQPGVEVECCRDVAAVDGDGVKPGWAHGLSVAAAIPLPPAQPGRPHCPLARGAHVRGQPAAGSATRARNSGSPVAASVIANRNGRSTVTTTGRGSWMMAMRALIATPVAAAASVPCSSTST